jgi:hypothetical protein
VKKYDLLLKSVEVRQIGDNLVTQRARSLFENICIEKQMFYLKEQS